MTPVTSAITSITSDVTSVMPGTGNHVGLEVSSDLAREGLSDSDSSQLEFAICEEKYLNGLIIGSLKSKRNVKIAYVNRRRSAFAQRYIIAGNLVCKYSLVVWKDKQQLEEKERTWNWMLLSRCNLQ